MVQEPIISSNVNESLAEYAFEDPTGYTYDPTKVSISGGILKLIGGTPGAKATITINVATDGLADVTILAGTHFSTNPLYPPLVTFSADADVTILTGDTSGDVAATCTIVGIIGNIGSYLIYTYLPTDPHIIAIGNNNAATGGSNVVPYPSGATYVEFPVLQPDQLTRWIRLSEISEVPPACGLAIEVQFSNDGGLAWGSNFPDCSDGEWVAYSKPVFNYYTVVDGGQDALKIRVTLYSDGTATPIINPVEINYYTFSEVPIPEGYIPRITSKQKVSDLTLGNVTPLQITDTALQYGEQWAINRLRAKGIAYDDVIIQGDVDMLTNLEIAATCRTLCITAMFGVGTTLAGAIASIAADNISKTFTQGQVNKGAMRTSPSDLCTMAGEAADTVIFMYRAGTGTGKHILPGYARDNELLDPSFAETGFDVRRRTPPPSNG